MTNRALAVIFAFGAAFTLCGSIVSAQTGVSAPAPPATGNASVDPDPHRIANVSLAIEGVYDDNHQQTVSNAALWAQQASGLSLGLTPNASLDLRRQRFQLGLAAGSNVRYYGDLHEMTVTSEDAGAGFSARLGRRTTVFVNQAFSHTPSNLYGLFAAIATPAPGDLIPGGTDYATNRNASNTFATTASVTQRVGRRSSLALNYGYQYSDSVEGVQAGSDLKLYDIGGHFTYSLNKDIGLRLGYVYRKAEYSPTIHPIEHNIDVGLDYERPLSRSRRTTIRFGMGSTVDEAPTEGTDFRQTRQQYRFLADAVLTHRMGRTWRMLASYRRSTAFVQGIAAPVLMNAATASSDGNLSRRVSLLVLGAYSQGDSANFSAMSAAAHSDPRNFRTYTGDAGLRIVLNRTLLAHVEYLHYFYNFGTAVELRPGLSPDLNRNVFRTSLVLSLPSRRH